MKIFTKSYILFSLLLLLNPVVNSFAQKQRIEFDHLSMDAGLSQHTVYDILQDEQGFIWFGTNDGLNKYDGYNFTIYRPELWRENTLNSNVIYAILQDSDQNIWVGTRNGINCFNPQTELFYGFDKVDELTEPLVENEIRAIFEDSQKNLWIGTIGKGLYKIAFENHTGCNKIDAVNKIVHYGKHETGTRKLNSNDVFSVFEDEDNQIWVGTTDGICKIDKSHQVLKRFITDQSDPDAISHAFVFSIVEDDNNTLWLGTNGGLIEFDKELEDFTLHQPQVDKIPTPDRGDVWRLFIDSKGVLWVGSLENGLQIFNRKDNTFTVYQSNPDYEHSISNNSVYSIMEDHSGVIWIGTMSGGLNKYDRLKKKFTHIAKRDQKPNSLSNNYVLSFCETGDSIAWIGTWGGGLNKYNRKTNRFTHYKNIPDNKNSLINDYVYSIIRDRNNDIWIATRGGLSRLNIKTESFTHYVSEDSNSVNDEFIRTLYIDRSGILWIGTYQGGLNRYDIYEDKFTYLRHDVNDTNSLSHNYIRAIHEDQLGFLWIATWGGGLNKYDRLTNTFKHYKTEPENPKSISSNFVYSLHEDKNGILWIGTNGGGLNKFEAKDEVFTHYNQKNGLPNNVVYGILEDEAGNLWLSTNHGLSKFNPQNETFRNYDVSNGLQNNEFNAGACYKNQNGEMYFGGINGFNLFHPSKVKDNPFEPKIVITDFQIFNHSVEPDIKNKDENNPLKKPVNLTDKIVLSHKDYVVSFEFTALHYSAPGKNQYAYMLEGFDEDWIYYGTKRFVTYTNLPPGDYTFKVKGSNSDGVWNHKGTALDIEVMPPFWATWWFRILVFIFLCIVAFVIFRLRVQRIERQKKWELEWQVKERTAEELEKKNGIQKSKKNRIDDRETFLKQTALRKKHRTSAANIAYQPDRQIIASEPRDESATIKLKGYNVQKVIHQGNRSIIYQAYDIVKNRPVILKTHVEEYPHQEGAIRIKREYEILKKVASDGIINVYGIERLKHKQIIILEDFGAIPLSYFLATKKLSLTEFLKLAKRITAILNQIHNASVIHKNISPSNILINPVTNEVKIIDFGMASLLSQESIAVINPKVMKTMMAYISPEQTGRMNRSTDYRSDFYSLGITLYEMLLGFPPFQANDALEFIHCHIAKEPIPPRQLNQNIPYTISEIIQKLLSKNAEDRYQSSQGILSDLDKCLSLLVNQGKIAHFTPGQSDVSSKFQIPQKLYGRNQEIEKLLDSFDRICSGKSEIMLIAGYSGIGKSVLVNEIHKPIVKQRAYFVSGTHNQFQRNVPYSAIIQAFKKIVNQILTESRNNLKMWQENILEAIGPNGQVIIDVIPEVELIIGKQPSVPTLSPTESQNRFNLAFLNFVKVFATKKHPLVLFLDNLQWADLSSLKLIEHLTLNGDIKYLFIIGAYRDNEVHEAHPLSLTLKNIKKSGVTVSKIALKPLELDDVNRLIADTLKHSPEATKSLAALCLKKTNGNPFFLRQFLNSLYKEKLIYFSFDDSKSETTKAGGWKWNIDKIKSADITDNVVDLMVQRIKKLSPETQKALKLATCIGNPFDLKTLAVVIEESQSKTAKLLWDAIEEGLLIPLDLSLKYDQTQDLSEASETHQNGDVNLSGVNQFKFLHDKVQQAAYLLIEEKRRNEIHLRIGRLLLKNSIEKKMDESLFDIVNQLNQSCDLITDTQEKKQLARLNLKVGRKAKASTAYEAASKYFETGVALLGAKCWKRQTELTLQLYEEAAEIAYLTGDFNRMKVLTEIIIQKTTDVYQKLQAYEVRILALIGQNKLIEAVKTGIEILNEMGAKLPDKPGKINNSLGQFEIKMALSGRKIHDLVALPRMEDPQSLAQIKIMSTIIWAVYSSAPELFPAIVFRMISLSLKHGNANESSLGYACYGLYLCGVAGDISTGYEFGQLALDLIEKLNAKEFAAKTSMIVNSFIKHWKEHPKNNLKQLLDGYQSALETGDLEYAANFAFSYCSYSFHLGKDLAVLEKEISTYFHAIEQLKQEKFMYYQSLYWQIVKNLRSSTKTPYFFIGKVFDEEKTLPVLFDAYDRTGIFDLHLQKAIIYYWFEEYEQAIEATTFAHDFIDGATSLMYVPLFYFYDSLGNLSIINTLAKPEQKKVLKQVTANQEKMKIWTKYAPMNYKHKYILVEAEYAKATSKELLAMKYYDQAIKLAGENEYTQEEALAYELAARFFIENGREKVAKNYIKEAYLRYKKWGAKAKALHIEERYAQVLPELVQKKDESFSSVLQGGTQSANLDFKSFMKASQIIASEINLEQLTKKMMEIVIENAGAQKGFIILSKKNRLYIEAQINANETEVTFCDTPLDEAESLSTTIVNYVARSKEALVLEDAARQGYFTNDNYIKERQTKSVAAIPLLNQSKLTGVLYLENNLISSAFTKNRLEILKLLSTQMAISIDNAQKYDHLEEQIQYLKSGLKKDESKKYLDILVTFMEQQKPFLDSKLTLKKLADHLEISSNHLSQVINENLDQNFFDFINTYRIDEVKNRLKNPKYKDYTILSIAYESGFNSSSVFYRNFKKITGKSPSEYMKTLE